MIDKNPRLQVLQLKLQGLSPKEISEELDMRMADVYRHDRAIKTEMTKQNELDLSVIDPVELNGVMDTVAALLPYMEKSVSKTLQQSKDVKPLFNDTLENAELVQQLVHRQILLEMEKEKPDIDMVERLTDIIIKTQKAYFNKDGIQVINMINDTPKSAQEAFDEKEARMRKLKEEFDAIDVDVADEKEFDQIGKGED